MTCEFCGEELLVLGKYCPNCGKVRNSRVDLNFKKEDKAKFAFQSEYYGVSFISYYGGSSSYFPGIGYAYSETKMGLDVEDVDVYDIELESVVFTPKI